MENDAALGTKESVAVVGAVKDKIRSYPASDVFAAMPEVRISIDAACCAGVTPQKHQAALETMRSCQIQVVNG